LGWSGPGGRFLGVAVSDPRPWVGGAPGVPGGGGTGIDQARVDRILADHDPFAAV
jgi:hypothetical protein